MSKINILKCSFLNKSKNLFIKFFSYYKIIIIQLIITLLFLFSALLNYKLDKVSRTINNQINKIKKDNNNKTYFTCFCAIAKRENLYIRQLIEYYINLGFDKFILGDNNLFNTEKLSDVIQDYIDNKTVDLIEIFNYYMWQNHFYAIIYENYKDTCDWITFFDCDEYLEIVSKNNKTMGIREYLSQKKFQKCEVIHFHWLMYPDNNLLYYDNRSLIERFPIPNYKDKSNKYIKSIVRGKLNKIPFFTSTSSHKPENNLIHCNSAGNKVYYKGYTISPPFLKYAYLKHYNTKTAEEYVNKIKRGDFRSINNKNRIKVFFSHNKFTDEKLKIFEKAFNLNLKNRREYYKSLYNS